VVKAIVGACSCGETPSLVGFGAQHLPMAGFGLAGAVVVEAIARVSVAAKRLPLVSGGAGLFAQHFLMAAFGLGPGRSDHFHHFVVDSAVGCEDVAAGEV
jgi:hypothetical protein